MKLVDGKSLFSIGEASRLLKMSERTLRFYDNQSLVKASYRDPDTGYRYYSSDQMYQVYALKLSKVLGISLDVCNDLFITTRSSAKNDYSRQSDTVQKAIRKKEDEIRALQSQIDELSSLGDNISELTEHEINGPSFLKRFPETTYMVTSFEGAEQRELDEPFIYEALTYVEEYTTLYFGRIWKSESLDHDEILPDGYLSKLRDGAEIPGGVSLPGSARLTTLPSGEYSTFLVSGIYDGGSWKQVRDYLNGGSTRKHSVIFGEECGFYADYNELREVVHMVRILPLDTVYPAS